MFQSAMVRISINRSGGPVTAISMISPIIDEMGAMMGAETPGGMALATS